MFMLGTVYVAVFSSDLNTGSENWGIGATAAVLENTKTEVSFLTISTKYFFSIKQQQCGNWIKLSGSVVRVSVSNASVNDSRFWVDVPGVGKFTNLHGPRKFRKTAVTTGYRLRRENKRFRASSTRPNGFFSG